MVDRDFRSDAGGGFAGMAASHSGGGGTAAVRAVRSQPLEAALGRVGRLAAAALIDALGVGCAAEVEAQGVPARDVRLRAWLLLRVTGADAALAVAFGPEAEMRAAFAAAHRARFGTDPGAAPLVIVAAGAEATGGAVDAPGQAVSGADGQPEGPA